MKLNDIFDKLKISTEKKDKILIVFLVGIFLMLIATPVSSISKKKNNTQTGDGIFNEELTNQTENLNTDAYISQLENKLEKTIQTMEGVGEVEVMITLKNNGKKIYEKNLNYESNIENLQEDGKKEEKNVIKNNPETVIVETSGDTSPIVVSENYPEIEGVLIVCQGGNDADVEIHIKEAVEALFCVDAHKIVVCKKQ
ncbi:MAG: stage III sporulation protein AG [Lachnospiraceae bacterium]